MKTLFGGTYDKIEEMASLVRRKVLDCLDPPAKSPGDGLRRTVQQLGGTIRTIEDASDPLRGGGSLVIYGKKQFEIWLSPFQSPLRANFTIAHELGHYLLHYRHDREHHGGPIVFNRFGSDEYEWQANRFAASFLMPRSDFVKFHAKYHGNEVLLAAHFQVSESAVKVRKDYILK